MQGLRLNEKKILITAAANELGRHLAEYYLQQGAVVISLDLATEPIEALKQAYPAFISIPCDITQKTEINAAFAQIARESGYVDVLINNAFIRHSEPLFCFFKQGDRKHHLEAWQSVLDINLTAPFVISSFFVEQLAQAGRRGVIINLSPAASLPGDKAGQSACEASIAGIRALTRSWSRELKPLGIRVVSVSPDYMPGGAGEGEGGVKEETVLRQAAGKSAITDLVSLAIGHEVMTGNVIALDGT